jgi:predicted DNA-binding protein with PD1-like motif
MADAGRRPTTGRYAAAMDALRPWPVRLLPGDDLRRALEAAVRAQGCTAAFVVAGIGSLKPTVLRLAGAEAHLALAGEVELLTVSGTVAAEGSHLHLSVADDRGRVHAGHAVYGCTVRTTAEILLALLPGWHFSREADAATGWAELQIRPRPANPAA